MSATHDDDGTHQYRDSLRSPLITTTLVLVDPTTSSSSTPIAPINHPIDTAKTHPRHIKIIAWISLLVAVMSMSAVGPTFVYITRDKHIQPILAATWRNQCVALFLLIPFIIERWRLPLDKRPSIWKNKRLFGYVGCLPFSPTVPELRIWENSYFMGNTFTWAASLALWVVSLEFTTTVRASLFSSAYPLFTALYLRFTGVRVSAGEFVGIGITIIGVGVAMITAALDDETQNDHVTYKGSHFIGDGLMLLVAVILAGDIIFAGKVRETVPLFHYSFLITIPVTIWLAICTVAIEGTCLYGIHSESMWGWLNTDVIYIMLIFSFVVGFVGLLGFNLSVAYISPILFATVQMVDPVLTSIMAWGTDADSSIFLPFVSPCMSKIAAGLEGLPSLSTWLGGLVIIIGVIVTVVFDAIRTAQTTTQTTK